MFNKDFVTSLVLFQLVQIPTFLVKMDTFLKNVIILFLKIMQNLQIMDMLNSGHLINRQSSLGRQGLG